MGVRRTGNDLGPIMGSTRALHPLWLAEVTCTDCRREVPSDVALFHKRLSGALLDARCYFKRQDKRLEAKR